MHEAERIREAYRHCEQLVRAQDKDRYIASLFAPAERRRYLFALYAFALEIARIKALVREPMAGMIRLQWWRDALGGSRPEEAAANPVMIALTDAGRRTGVSLGMLTTAVEARQDELQGIALAGDERAILAMAAQFLGGEDDAVKHAAQHAAEAMAAGEPEKARSAYAVFRDVVADVPEQAKPAFLTVALVPLLLRRPHAPQWRRQIAMLRAAWFGFPTV
jgi:Squalene/phytoene synthase